ncbi:S-adenosyl-L-methionine-dependent methyltransferase [Thelephora ganbajun]|uniref:S-adenosyl-L-methionine-dependent methyltransferase n=1 Tax=Thelephora ganbajun TaxID=370292 RepID=A0ACB6ZHF0_THEGA|nr:S-adenosyl-L-methionine-dependent methyltransferase [Thelephora ganbajun]
MNFYFEAAKILDKLDKRQGSIKGILSSVPEKDKKRMSALVIETLKYKPVLKDVISNSKLLKEEKKLKSENLTLVLVHDLLLANGIQAGDGPLKQAVLRHRTRLHSEFTREKIRHGARSNEELAQTGDERAGRIPRYVRVNTILWTSSEAVEYFKSKGFQVSDPLQNQYGTSTSHMVLRSNPDRKGFSEDEHIPNLLLFNPQARFHEEETYHSGKIILQDKASCFPATVLAQDVHKLHEDFIDATAAPGNKTTHLSALLGNKGKLFAFERDANRFATLKSMIAKAGCRNVEPMNADFLTILCDDQKYADVTHILLDPSCSGSGIVNRLDHLTEQDKEDGDPFKQERLEKLASFQLMMIKHAMKFPSVKRIVYSTCSIHPTENEHVVSKALESGEAKLNGFRLAPRSQVLPNWHRRGIPEEMVSDGAECVVRCSPGEDATNGFFVSCFVRQSRGESTELGKRGHLSVNYDTDEGETRERGEGIVHMEKSTDRRKRNRPKKKRKSSMLA